MLNFRRSLNIEYTIYTLQIDPSVEDPITISSEDLSTLTVQGFIIGYLVDAGQVATTSHQAWTGETNLILSVAELDLNHLARPIGKFFAIDRFRNA